MNKSKLKSYAPQARKDFIAAVTARANLLGLSEAGGTLEVASGERKGDIAIIAGREWPAKVFVQRERLIKHIKTVGFSQTMEAVAYTWFNRFAALRYMELHDYLGHGHRALSSSAGGLPDILTHAADLAAPQSAHPLPGLNQAKVLELKLAGNRDGELYRLLLVAQCNVLSNAMPFLFERIDDDTELLLPDNLLRSDSVIAKLVAAITEPDWSEVEIIGWLYQFYISEKKDQVIGKVVKSEDIPAATQLFTPNWIVQYLVQNSVGRLWLMANPQSTLASEWPYYITPAEQTPEVQAQLDALIQTRVREDGDTLNPESITVLDPACGSGHILVVAYDVLKAIYLERGYQPRVIPRLILEKNLFGLDIDDRAAQMAGFALLMKARADDRRLFTATDDAGNLQPPKLNVLSLQESKGLSVDELATHLAPFKVQRATIAALVDTFEHAKTFGSLIQIPYALKTHLAVLPKVLALVKQSGDMYATAAADDLLPLVQQAQVLAMQFDAVVANPPYMGRKFIEPSLKQFIGEYYAGYESDIFSASIARGKVFAKISGSLGFMTPMVWMFISSHETLRTNILNQASLSSLIQLEYNASGEVRVPLCTFVFLNSHIPDYCGSFIRLTSFAGYDIQGPKVLEAIANPKCSWSYAVKPDEFKKIPSSPVAYWISESVRNLFIKFPLISDVADVKQGLATADNNRFLRLWHEVSVDGIGFSKKSKAEAVGSNLKWFPYNKGGDYRRWYGNQEYVVNWSNDGLEIRQFGAEDGGRVRSRAQNVDYFFKPSISWSFISSSYFGVRSYPAGFIFDVAGSSAFPKNEEQYFEITAFLCSSLAPLIMTAMNPTLNFQVGNVEQLPFVVAGASDIARECIDLAMRDWNDSENSWGFTSLFQYCEEPRKFITEWWTNRQTQTGDRFGKMKSLEKRNNELFIEAFGVSGEISPDVVESQITLARADREKDSQRLISYAIGCMMGRYSLDEPGLIYAHAGNVGFESGRYATFPADADGIVPITDELWFADDACSRVREFLRAVWGPDTLEENMAWLAESLGKKSAKEASETPDETIRRYIADKFFKDHLQTYKKRPIYWHFSSGKQGAFQALVYLHRYHEGTLARLRAEYVVPLTGKIQSRIEMLQKDALAASSTAARNKLSKEVEKLKKKHVELLAYDEQLRHYADMRITLDLDDGVKVNYGKFGDLLDSVKVVTGGASDD